MLFFELELFEGLELEELVEGVGGGGGDGAGVGVVEVEGGGVFGGGEGVGVQEVLEEGVLLLELEDFGGGQG